MAPGLFELRVMDQKAKVDLLGDQGVVARSALAARQGRRDGCFVLAFLESH